MIGILKVVVQDNFVCDSVCVGELEDWNGGEIGKHWESESSRNPRLCDVDQMVGVLDSKQSKSPDTAAASAL